MSTDSIIGNRRHKRVKLRRLIEIDDESPEIIEVLKPPPCEFCRKLTRTIKGFMGAILLLLLLAGVDQLRQGNDIFSGRVKNFVNNYSKQYYQIIHGSKNYCDTKMNVNILFNRIYQSQILHQGRALQQLKMILRNDSEYNSIAIVGPSGVGKSMLAKALQQYFPWEENVHTYAWNTHVSDEAEKFHMVRLFIENLSECGRNLLIFDNLTPCDKELVTILNNIINKKRLAADFSKLHIIVMYIFRLSSVDYEPNIYEKHFEELQNLPNTRTVQFKSFGKEEIEDCIRREMAMNNMTLTENKFTEIMLTIDPQRSGCKNVCAKVLTYGKPI